MPLLPSYEKPPRASFSCKLAFAEQHLCKIHSRCGVWKRYFWLTKAWQGSTIKEEGSAGFWQAESTLLLKESA
jgi:hypothetical protein